MSIFSGKCDFCDSVMIIYCDNDPEKLVEFLANAKIYIRGRDDREHLIDVKTEMDAVKYYPYLESIFAYNDGKSTIVLSSDSFIDSEERQHLGYYIRDGLKYWRKCKRNKTPFILEECAKKMTWNDDPSDYILEIARRIEKDGDKAEFDGIHDYLHEHYRKRWFEEMIRVGWDVHKAFNWCFNEFYPRDDVIKLRLGEELYTKYFVKE